MIRFRFVEDHRGVYDVKRMCSLVDVPRSSFYAWAAGPTTAAQARQAVDAELATVIEQVWRDSRRTYGWPRVWGQLTRRRGMAVSRRRVARIMRDASRLWWTVSGSGCSTAGGSGCVPLSSLR